MLEHNHLDSDHDGDEQHKNKHEVDGLYRAASTVDGIHGEEAWGGVNAAVEAEARNVEAAQADSTPVIFAVLFADVVFTVVVLVVVTTILLVNLH